MPVFTPLPIALASGSGAWLKDLEGREYLDAFAGVAVCNLGHSHPDVTKAICDQAGKLIHTSNWYEIPVQAALAERLCKLAQMDNVFFCNSGAEANEAAIKIARMIGNVAVDTAIGAIPLAGDVFDVFFKANQRNLRIIHEHLGTPKRGPVEIDGTAVRVDER